MRWPRSGDARAACPRRPLEQEFAFGSCASSSSRLWPGAPSERSAILQGPAALAGGARLGGGSRTPEEATSFAILHGLYWLCANLAARRPLCLIVDDAHWGDTPSLRYLAFLLPRLEELRVALVLAARPGEAAPRASCSTRSPARRPSS